jgi:hypothetical protein
MGRAMMRLVTVTFARLHQRVGAVGVCGLLLIAAALVSGLLAWHAHQRWERSSTARALPIVALQQLRTEQPARNPLPPASDVPLLLARMQRAAVQQGLGWPAADYRLNAATDDTPAHLEVRCALVGPYPGIRRFLTVLLQDNPTLTLREFSLSRSGAEITDVQAKLAIVTYLASGPAGPAAVSGATP